MKKYKIRATIFAILLFIACISITVAAAWQVGALSAKPDKAQSATVPTSAESAKAQADATWDYLWANSGEMTEEEYKETMALYLSQYQQYLNLEYNLTDTQTEKNWNIGRGIALGAPVFVVGAMISAALTELYYAAIVYSGKRKGLQKENQSIQEAY